MQPTGNPFGKLFRSAQNFVSLQNEMECIYCVVDLHAITVFQDPNLLHDNVLETTASFLATGLNPDKSIFLISPQFQVTRNSGFKLCFKNWLVK